jgi:hypothetical protein
VHASEGSIGRVGAGPWLGRRWARRRAEQLQIRRQAAYQRLAWHVEDILVGCNLFQADASVAGGRVFHIPKVVSVDQGPPIGLTVRMLPGQIPEDFAVNAHRIAYNLDMADIRVIELGPYHIRLVLLPKQDSARAS